MNRTCRSFWLFAVWFSLTIEGEALGGFASLVLRESLSCQTAFFPVHSIFEIAVFGEHGRSGVPQKNLI